MSHMPIVLPFRTLAWEGEFHGRFLILDQRRLPRESVEIELETVEHVFEAIRTLAVRGAPAIGAAAAYGLVIGARRGKDAGEIRRLLHETASYLAGARPTARNLFWALNRVERAADAAAGTADPDTLLRTILSEAQAIEAEDRAACEAIGRHAMELLSEPVRAMTHCNAGALATCGIGTALAPLYVAHAWGREVSVLACETRPLLQGARLTAWELSQAGIDVAVCADSARAHLIRLGRVNCVIVGADRIARNGDAANKIGTYDLAIVAERHGIPVYVAAPLSTFDAGTAHGKDIPIEERSGVEVANLFDTGPIVPGGVPCLNPAFDVTPAALITAIVTEKGVAHPPNEETVGALLA